MRNATTFVYYLLDESGAVVYVGRSAALQTRLRAHYSDAKQPTAAGARKREWLSSVRELSLAGPFDWATAKRFERDEIERLQPRGNRVFTLAHGWMPRAAGGFRFEVAQ